MIKNGSKLKRILKCTIIVGFAVLSLIILLSVSFSRVARNPLRNFGVRWFTNKVDGKIEFYGRIIDQNDFPVENVIIPVNIGKFRFSLPETPSRIIRYNVKTDRQGYFNIIGEYGTNISFGRFKKTGYEYIYDQAPIRFNFEQNTFGIHQSDPSNPVTYRMRKKGEETYIVHLNGRTDCFRYDVKESGSQKALDFIIGGDISENGFANPMLGHLPLTIDIKTKALYNPKSNKWKIELSPGNPDGGILVSPEKLYVAPEAGYLPSLIIEPDDFIKTFDLESNDKPSHLSKGLVYIYLKSRAPAIYSRFVITGIFTDEKSIEMSAGGYATNPYGDRNLEAATDLPSAIRDKLWQEVRDCYINGRRPQKPNLPKMIEDFESQGSRWGR